MIDFDKMRQTMLDCQIRPSGVVDPAILSAFETTPRQDYVPEALRSIAYSDKEIAFGPGGRFLVEPMIHAKILQALGLTSEQIVLDVGVGLGYSVAILSSLVSTVVALESSEALLQSASKSWDKHNISNVVSLVGDLPAGAPVHAPYDAIIINGAVYEVPQALLSQLSEQGRLICVLRKSPQAAGQVTLFQRNGAQRALFDAGTSYLTGFEPVPVFEF